MPQLPSVRRLIPFVLISAMAVLSLVAAVISLHDSTPIAFFSQPPPGNPRAVETFHEEVKATLDAPSFLFGGLGSVGPIEYQSPDRTKDVGLIRFVVIGNTTYQELNGYKNTVTRWGEYPLTLQQNKLYGPVRVKFVLRQLLGLKSVRRDSGGFVAKEIIPANDISMGTAGYPWGRQAKRSFSGQSKLGVASWSAIAELRMDGFRVTP